MHDPQETIEALEYQLKYHEENQEFHWAADLCIEDALTLLKAQRELLQEVYAEYSGDGGVWLQSENYPAETWIENRDALAPPQTGDIE